jgi:hypothetical protein
MTEGWKAKLENPLPAQDAFTDLAQLRQRCDGLAILLYQFIAAPSQQDEQCSFLHRIAVAVASQSQLTRHLSERCESAEDQRRRSNGHKRPNSIWSSQSVAERRQWTPVRNQGSHLGPFASIMLIIELMSYRLRQRHPRQESATAVVGVNSVPVLLLEQRRFCDVFWARVRNGNGNTITIIKNNAIIKIICSILYS